MVNSIVPGSAGSTSALGLDTRYAKPGASQAQRRDEATTQGDRVELSGASIAAARESVRAGLAQIHQALVLGQDAQTTLVKVQEIARNGGPQADLDALLGAFKTRVQAVLADGGTLAGGQNAQITAEPGATPLTIPGVDLRLGGDVISVGEDAQATDPALTANAQKSLETLQDVMSRLLDSARSLEAHQGFLGAAEGVTNVRTDLDADSARLLALQVRQGLEAFRGSIANVEPQAVLSLFRA